MAAYLLPYGHQTLSIELSDACQVDWIEPPYVAPAEDPLRVVRDAVQNPVDGQSLRLYANARSVVIAINDKTRPVPHEHLLPPLLDELRAIGIPDQAIAFLIATGTHVPMQPDEFRRVLPRKSSNVTGSFSHNCDDPEEPGWLRDYHARDADLGKHGFLKRICALWSAISNRITLPVFRVDTKLLRLAWPGGQRSTPTMPCWLSPKRASPSLSTTRCARISRRSADQIGVQFALNAILNGEKKIVRAVSGSPRAVIQRRASRSARKFAR